VRPSLLEEAAGGPSARRRAGAAERRCARPGCTEPAAATLRFHSTRREAVLVDVEPGGSRSGDLCGTHARTVSLPRGWALRDGRSSSPSPIVHAAPVARGARHRAGDGDARTARVQIPEPRTPLLKRAFRNVLPG
jgi:hypothetical protein